MYTERDLTLICVTYYICRHANAKPAHMYIWTATPTHLTAKPKNLLLKLNFSNARFEVVFFWAGEIAENLPNDEWIRNIHNHNMTQSIQPCTFRTNNRTDFSKKRELEDNNTWSACKCKYKHKQTHIYNYLSRTHTLAQSATCSSCK